MKRTVCEVLFCPGTEELRFLPEGPYPSSDRGFSWVAIQHGPAADRGSLNLYDWSNAGNRSIPLDGRPGFAFPTDQPQTFVVGLERRLALVDTRSGREQSLAGPVDADVEGTIINDGLVFPEGLVFGCKDLNFRDPKAGLYLWRRADRRLLRLRDDQVCSNGKVVLERDGSWLLLDIDSPRKTVVAYELDVARGRLSPPRVVIDLRDQASFPDGMIATPDGNSALIAIYDPGDAEWGEVRQYALSNGSLEAVWQLPGSPQATCPQWVTRAGQVWLVVTTAVEHMQADRRQRCPHAGCLFAAPTAWDRTADSPVFVVPV